MHDAHTDTFAPVERKRGGVDSTPESLSSIFTFCARIWFLFISFNTIPLAADVVNECRMRWCAQYEIFDAME